MWWILNIDNVKMLPICIIGGALSLIIYQCFPHEDVYLIFVLRSVSRNTVPREVFPNTLPREQEVYRNISEYDLWRSCHVISPLFPLNIKKYIPSVWWILTMSKSILQWWENGQYSNKRTWVHVKNLVFSNTRYPKYPMILKMNRVRIGYWKIFRVRVGYRVPVAPCLGPLRKPRTRGSYDRLSPETNLDGMQSRNRAGVKEEQMRKERTPITIFDSNDFDA